MNMKAVHGVVFAYYVLNVTVNTMRIRQQAEEIAWLKQDRKKLVKLVNSMSKHTTCTEEEKQLAIDINFDVMIKTL